MKKYIFLIAISIISLASVNWASAQTTAQNQITACNNKVNGQDCSYKVQLSGRNPEPTDTQGKCDRNGEGRLYCNSTKKDNTNTLTAWEDCFNKSQPNDACKDNGRLGTCQRQGSGDNLTCDTTKTPTGNPGGSTPPTCGAAPCVGNTVCVNINNTGPKCENNAVSSDGKCGAAPCVGNTVCVNINNTEPKCENNAATTGSPADNGTTSDASSPQTVGFINPSRFNSITALIAGIINALLGILGAITVAVLVASGFKYMTSSNPGEVGQALEGIRNAIVGLMIIMGSFLITQYVISALAV
jgi:hypothetical protein